MSCIRSIIKNSAFKTGLALSLLFFTNFSSAQDPKLGETLFKQNCTSCHKIGSQLIGPDLKNVHTRRDEAWIIKFVRNSQAVIKSGDPYAVELFKKYQTVMPNHNFSDDEIKGIIAYIKQESEAPVAAAATGGTGAQASTGGVNNYTLGGLFILIVILLIVILVLNRVISVLERLLLKKQGGEEAEVIEMPRESRFKKFTRNKKAVVLTVLFLMVILAVWGWEAMMDIGIQKGYQPVQPIKFSHELHAGVNKINCQYCHSGAYKSKNASIPSANVCMNCHNYVKSDSPEIQKIYKALDYNPETRTYGQNQKPIEWIRVHNLPDLAYFNHSQHVKVAGIRCQKCHGEVEKMPVIYQHEDLTMGWCISCHRETDVNRKGNAYYDNLKSVHDRLKKGERITAATLGGIECGRCHY